MTSSTRATSSSPMDTPISSNTTSSQADKSILTLGTALLENARQRITIASIRSLFSCMGIGEATPFNLPSQHQLVMRMKHNLAYFLTNYLLLTLLVFAFLLLFFHPIQLIVCILVGWCWFLVLTQKPKDGSEHFVVCGRQVKEQDVLPIATCSTLVFLVFFLLPTVLYSLTISISLSGLHAVLRHNRPKDDDMFAQFPSKPLPRTDVEDQV